MLKIKPLYLIAIVLVTAFATWKLTLMGRYPSAHITLLTVKRLDSSLSAANEIVRNSNRIIAMTFDNRTKDPWMAEKAAIWSPKIHSAIEHADRMAAEIEEMKILLKKEAGLAFNDGLEKYHEDDIDAANRLMINQGQGRKLMDSLRAFSELILVPLPENSRKKLSILPIANSLQDPIENYFKETPAIAAVALLTKLQNEVLRSSNIVADFCQSQITNHVIIQDDWFEALISQNTTNLLPDQTLEIKAGLGSFSTATKPIIIIGGEQQRLNEIGVAIYKIKVGNANGTVPVSISFKEPNTGATITKTSTVSYTVTKQ